MTTFLSELWWFGLKQAWACIFGGLLLVAIILTKYFWPDDAILPRYDFLFFYAVGVQGLLLALKLESWEEARVIFMFHLVGTGMELFKTHVGSWSYPEENFIRIMGVPLFSGFMYSSVGSYLARVWRSFTFRFDHYPPLYMTFALGVAIYINFFTHHYFWDFRYGLFALTALLFVRTWIYFSVRKNRYKMPIILALFLGSFFIWIAENVATFGNVWVYPNQRNGWELVPIEKMGSWFLLMILSGVLLTLVQRPQSEP